MYMYIPDQQNLTVCKSDIYSTLWSYIKPAINTDYKKTALTFSKVKRELQEKQHTSTKVSSFIKCIHKYIITCLLMVYQIYNHLSRRVYGLNYYNYYIIILYLEQYTVYILQNSDSYSYMVNVITLDFTTQLFTDIIPVTYVHVVMYMSLVQYMYMQYFKVHAQTAQYMLQ